uniref:Killer toxin subunit alpha/beta-like protein n=1 Tax=Komagataella phaffii TaxID=460519 RepID=A0A2R4PI98_9ASCO|nr:killer toxin subunit alpha/beta-like protein [Komagataella phaffii]
MFLFGTLLLYLGIVQAVYFSNTTSRLPDSRGISVMSTSAGCSGADEVARNLVYAWWDGPKTDQNKREVLEGIEYYRSAILGNTGITSRKWTNGRVHAFIWIGSMVQTRGIAENILPLIKEDVENSGAPNLVYLEYVDPDGDPMKGFGIAFETTGGGEGSMQRAVREWSKGKSYNTRTGSKTMSQKSMCYLSYANRRRIDNNEQAGNCDYVRMESGMDLTARTGVNGESLEGYNRNLDFTKLQAGQPVCYSIGKRPDFRPSQNADGSCKAYQVKQDESCASIAAQYFPLSVNEIESFNSENHQWKGCDKLQKDYKLCLSSGTPPRPTPNPLAECGPYAPGDLYNQPCPLNACCSEWGFCGLTEEFCEANICDSNCGYGSLPSIKASSFRKVAYWLDTNGPMHSDPQNIKDFDIVHYSFADINEDMSISVGNNFNVFKEITLKKIIAFGGWEFSTNPSTYQRFRDAVSDGKRDIFAQNIVNFMNEHNLDGVDFDWEYPEAPDIPNIPAGTKGDGLRYAKLMERVKELDSSKTVSVAIPASYWYLKGFPLKEMDKHVDYFVLMNYDYVGQWDYGKPNTGIGCHSDRSTTERAIKMIVKSGIDTTKVHGGLANYGRAFRLNDKNCKSYWCGFQGPSSPLPPGPITGTPGFLALSEIEQLSFNEKTFDSDSKCYIGTYNDGQDWVAWMDQDTIKDTENWYQNTLGFGGSALWLYNYYEENSEEYGSLTCELSANDNDDYDAACYELDDNTGIRPFNVPVPKINIRNILSIISRTKPDNDNKIYLSILTFLSAWKDINSDPSTYDKVKNDFNMIANIIGILSYNLDINEGSSASEIRKREDYYSVISIIIGSTYTSRYFQPGFHWGNTKSNDRDYIKSVNSKPSMNMYIEGISQTLLYTEQTIIDDWIFYEFFDYQNDIPFAQSSAPFIPACNEREYRAGETAVYNEENVRRILQYQAEEAGYDDICEFIEKADCLKPVYIVNINGQSPGVACNALRYVTRVADHGRLPYNELNKLNRNSIENHKIKRRRIVNAYKTSDIPSNNNLNYNIGKPWERDEFPPASTTNFEVYSGLYFNSVAFVEISDNWIDGQNLNRFFQRKSPGVSNTLASRQYIQNDWTEWFPNCNDEELNNMLGCNIPYICKKKTCSIATEGQDFYFLINIRDWEDCIKYLRKADFASSTSFKYNLFDILDKP